MQNYELLYIIPTQFADTEIDGMREKMGKMIEQTGAKVTRNESLGKIKLAYPIKHQRHGTYVLIHFTGEPSVVAGIDRTLRLDDDVLRHIIVDLAPGSENKKFEIASYVPPLSEEAREMRRPGTPASPAAAPRSAAPARTETAAVPMKPAEASMSMEELDKKLDEILDQDAKV